MCSCDQILITLPFYQKNYHNLNFIRIRPENPLFLRGGLGSSSIILALGTNLKTSKAEKLKLKFRKFLASYTGKAGKWDLFAATPILNRVSYNEQPAIVLCRR